MTDEVKQAVDGLMTAFEEFKKTNDERLSQIEKKGSADPLIEEKLSKINDRMNAFETINQRLTKAEEEAKASKDALSRIETKLNRPGAGGFERDPVSERKAAFDAWCRKGKENLGADEIKALVASDDTAGGYLAPVEYVREIIKGAVEFSPMRPLVRVRQTTQRSAQIPKRTGTFSAVWVSEIGSRSETTGLSYGLEEIPTHELTAEVYISMQELEDSAFNLESELNMEFAEQFGVAEGAAVVNGTGVGKPFGILQNADISSDNSGTAATIADANGQANGLISLYHNLKTAYARNGSWILNRVTLGSVRKLKDGNNNYIWQPGLANGIPNTILGASYTEVPDMPNEGANAYPIAFGDFRRGYVLVDRIAMSVLRDPYTKASVGQVKFVARRRLGGQVVLAEAIRKLKCAA